MTFKDPWILIVIPFAPEPEHHEDPEETVTMEEETLVTREEKMKEDAPEDTLTPDTAMKEEPADEVNVEAAGADPNKTKTTLDLFGEHSSTLADRLKDTSEKRVADKLMHEKIDDLKNAIGINEKFQFINELFDGSLKNYEDAIGKLNDCQSPEQAKAMLIVLQSKFGWDSEEATSKSFIDLVNRKF